MPDDLKRTLAALLSDIDDTTAQLKSGKLNADEWQAQVARSLVEHHIAAYLSGQEMDELNKRAKTDLKRIVGEQVDYLNKFADKIAETGWKDAYQARAAMYAGAIKESYWRGASKGLPLPGYPADGQTSCLSNCQCHWEFDTLDEEEDDIDAYWRLGAAEHCGGCSDRAARWNPYKIRGGIGE